MKISSDLILSVMTIVQIIIIQIRRIQTINRERPAALARPARMDQIVKR